MTGSHVHIDDSRFPMVVVTFDGLATEAEFDTYLERMSALLKRRTKNVVILDATRAERSPASQRKKQADWIRDHDALLRAYSLGTAFVIPSPLIRGILTAVLWMQELPNAHTVVGTLPDAERWALERLRSVGLTAPPATAPRTARSA